MKSHEFVEAMGYIDDALLARADRDARADRPAVPAVLSRWTTVAAACAVILACLVAIRPLTQRAGTPPSNGTPPYEAPVESNAVCGEATGDAYPDGAMPVGFRKTYDSPEALLADLRNLSADQMASEMTEAGGTRGLGYLVGCLSDRGLPVPQGEDPASVPGNGEDNLHVMVEVYESYESYGLPWITYDLGGKDERAGCISLTFLPEEVLAGEEGGAVVRILHLLAPDAPNIDNEQSHGDMASVREVILTLKGRTVTSLRYEYRDHDHDLLLFVYDDLLVRVTATPGDEAWLAGLSFVWRTSDATEAER